MKKIINPKPENRTDLMQRPSLEKAGLLAQVNQVFEEVKKQGDAAVKKFHKLFDKSELKRFEITENQLKDSFHYVSKELQEAIQLAKKNIETFHLSQVEPKQIIETTKGVKCWRESRPIERVGIYIPGGSAPLFSSVLMLGIPAKIAACKEVVLFTPPNDKGEINPTILFAANLVGINRVFPIGGIQAIAAMTFGTESIPKVDKIFGPGNQYVTAAKQVAQSYGVAIDMPAGPSEVLIIADESCVPAFVAADLLSQAEHGPDSQVILLCNNELIADKVITEINKQMEALPRKELVLQALNNSRAIILNTIDECMDFSNQYAPEHLILAVKNHGDLAQKVSNAGSVFLGNYSCESAGDYASGTNHTLPTNGYARSYSGVSIDSFVKKITFQELDTEGIRNLGPTIELMAEAEQLAGHKNAVTIRLNSLT